MWFNNNILIHRFCGYLMTLYGILHTIGHLLGSMRHFSEADDISKVNKVTLHHDFKHKMSYEELLFTTTPGITGIILVIIMFLMALTSMK